MEQLTVGIAIALALGVTFLNGFTDAPNSIATAVATGALSMRRACLVGAIFNLVGLVASLSVSMKVTQSVIDGANLENKREIGVISILFTTVLFSALCWLFSMPSSESHALLASLFGASFAISGTVKINAAFVILAYMAVSCVGSFFVSCITYKVLKGANFPWRRLQGISCALSSAMHGSQDGQKLVALFIFLYPAGESPPLIFPSLVVGTMLFLGTVLGGGRIIKTMGEGIAPLNEKSAFVSELSSGVCLGLMSALGWPVSTSNIKACSVAGAGLCDGEDVCYKTLVKMALVAILTFPVCFAISYFVTTLLV